MSSSTSGSFMPANGDLNAGHASGAAVITTDTFVVAVPASAGVYTGFTVYNMSASATIVGSAVYAPGTAVTAGDSLFIVPPNGSYSYSADRDCINGVAVRAVDVTAAAAGAFTDATAMAPFTPVAPVLVLINMANG